jgi:uncharacterized protein (TIGR04255 family)
MSTPSREIYPRSPLSLVTIEFMFGYEPRLNSREIRDSFATAVREIFPIFAEEEFSSTGANQSSAVPQVSGTNAERSITTALSSRSFSFVIAGHGYKHFEQLVEYLMPTVKAALDVVPGVRVERLGLRYLNELRLPVSGDDGREWAVWVNPALIATGPALPSSVITGFQGRTAFRTGPERMLEMVFGDAFGSSIVSEEIPLTVPSWPESQFFIIDIDSSWVPETPVEATVGSMEDMLMLLHAPIGDLFEWSITDSARDIFRGVLNDNI